MKRGTRYDVRHSFYFLPAQKRWWKVGVSAQKDVILLTSKKQMQQKFDEIARDIEAGRTAEALEKARRLHAAEGADKARLFYLEGRAYMKRSQWTEAIGCFLKSEELDPEGPAAESKRMLQDILDFYNKDMYNQ